MKTSISEGCSHTIVRAAKPLFFLSYPLSIDHEDSSLAERISGIRSDYM